MIKPNLKEIRQTIEKFEEFLNILEMGRNFSSECKARIKTISDSILNEEVLNVLKTVPIDELNRNKKGYRLKHLKEFGFTTIADLSQASVLMLSSINGISEDAASSIMNDYIQIYKEASKEVKIRISVDTASEKVAELVDAVAVFTESVDISEECRKMIEENREPVIEAITDLSRIKNIIKYIFASKSRKEKAINAFNRLEEHYNGEFRQRTEEIQNRISHLKKASGQRGWDYFNNNNVQFFNTIEKINPGFLSNDDEIYGLPEDLAGLIEKYKLDTEGLKCELRRYQEWGVRYILYQKKVLLGDEMGLGKTIQAIAAMVSLRNTGAERFLVVCPAAVVTNWCREIEKMSDLSFIKIHGNDKVTALDKWLREGGVGVTTFETTSYFIRKAIPFMDMLIVDEAHYIKNPGAKRTQNTKQLCGFSKNILFMTGTPMENNVNEMTSLIEVLNPGIARSISGLSAFANASKYRERIIPVYYRRKREDVLRELPELIENKDWCTMTNEDYSAYCDSLYTGNFMAVRRISWNVNNIENSSKAQRLLEIVEEAENEERKIIVFSFFLDTIRKIKELLGDRCLEAITGSMTSEKRQAVIDEFEKSAPGSVLPLQIISGGTGLNIQSASVVVICEPQYKPSVENQAISRAYRMGQTRNVIVHRLLCEDSVDERISDILDYKQKLFDQYADESEAAKGEITDKVLGSIIEQEKRRIQGK